MVGNERKAVLQDHVAVKGKLVPPFVHRLGGRMSPYSWTRQLVPEAIWIGLAVDHLGYEGAQQLCRAIGRAASQAAGGAETPAFIKLSSFTKLSATAKASMLSSLNAKILGGIREALRPLAAVTPDHPLSFLTIERAASDKGERFAKLLREFYDRNSRTAVLSMAIGYDLGLDQGKVHVASHLIDDLAQKFSVIGHYPDTEEARNAAGSFRASASMLFLAMRMDGRFEEDAPWVHSFWEQIAGFGPCLFEDTLQDELVESDDPLEQFVFGFRNAVRADLQARLDNWPLDLNDVDAYEVVAALLSRQATLVMEMASSPGVWTQHVAPILLRAIADVFIGLAWILKDPQARARRFVEDGLGAIKLQIAHHQRQLEGYTDPEGAETHRQMIEVWGDWLSSQRIEALVEVNLKGTWSGMTTRKMAEEADCIDFYNYVYQPFSGVAHSNWAHVSMFNSVHCQNPAHRGHRLGAIAPPIRDANWLFLASKYLRKTFAHFDQMQGLELPQQAFEFMTSQSELMEDDSGG